MRRVNSSSPWHENMTAAMKLFYLLSGAREERYVAEESLRSSSAERFAESMKRDKALGPWHENIDAVPELFALLLNSLADSCEVLLSQVENDIRNSIESMSKRLSG